MSDFKNGHNFFRHQQKSSLEPSQFTGALGSGPDILTNLFSSYHFPETNIRSFSELLAGAIATQLPATGELSLAADNWGNNSDHNKGQSNGIIGANNGIENGSRFKENRPGNIALPTVMPVFNVSPGFSPSSFLTSPTFLSPLASMPSQQTLVHLNAQAALSQAHLSIQTDTLPFRSSSNPSLNHSFQTSIFNAPSRPPISDLSNLERRPPHHNNFPIAVDKPADDGYNWRKYGQKQVKGSEYPRSYYRCTNPNCPVKKKVERSFDGHITEIIYKGQHNHERPLTGRRGNKDASFLGDEGQLGNSLWSGGGGWDYDSAQATSLQLNGPSDSEESGENSEQIENHDDFNGEPNPKRMRNGGGQSDGGFTHRTMTEPKIVVQTRSDIDLLDDGYRWRKYGQKVVKGNPNPRSYYKCTTNGCKVRKHVERASTDQSAVITTYEGKHNHDVPAARGSAVHAVNMEANQLKVHNSVAQMSFGSNDNQVPITLRLKEEQFVSS